MTMLEKIARALYLTPLPDGDPLCVALENAADDFGCETAEQIREWISALTVKAARAAIEAMMEPNEAMIEAYNSALNRYIDGLPKEVRARTKEPGGYVLVSYKDKPVIRHRAMMQAILDEPSSDKR